MLSPFLCFIIPKDVDKQDSVYSSFSVEWKVWSGDDLIQTENLPEQDKDSEDKQMLLVTAVQKITLNNSGSKSEKIDAHSIKLRKKKEPISYMRLFSRRIFTATAFCGFLVYFEYWYMQPVMSIRLEEFGLGPIMTGIYFSIYYIMYTIGNLCISFFTNRFDSKLIIVVWLFMWGWANFLVGPSPFLPNSFVIMWVGQFLNGAFTNFLITCLPVMIDDVWKEYPRRKNEVSDVSSGIFTLMLNLGQTVAPIYGSNMINVIGFRWWADSIAYLLIAYSIVYLIIWKIKP